jgi:hypothetical protein
MKKSMVLFIVALVVSVLIGIPAVKVVNNQRVS